MILPVGSLDPDNLVVLRNYYYGQGRRAIPNRKPEPQAPLVDIVRLSLAAKRLVDQAERLSKSKHKIWSET